jgi:hypothetical protein
LTPSENYSTAADRVECCVLSLLSRNRIAVALATQTPQKKTPRSVMS